MLKILTGRENCLLFIVSITGWFSQRNRLWNKIYYARWSLGTLLRWTLSRGGGSKIGQKESWEGLVSGKGVGNLEASHGYVQQRNPELAREDQAFISMNLSVLFLYGPGRGSKFWKIIFFSQIDFWRWLIMTVFWQDFWLLWESSIWWGEWDVGKQNSRRHSRGWPS